MDRKNFRRSFEAASRKIDLYDIRRLGEETGASIDRLPYAIRILVENLLRHLDGRIVRQEDLARIAAWEKTYPAPVEIPHHPARVLMQDFTGVPAIVDLAAMRDAVREAGGDPAVINPLVPVELVVDHSVQVDWFGSDGCREKNVAMEYERNGERYRFLKWAQKSFRNLQVVPPNSGICHQVNLEYLGRVVIEEEGNGDGLLAYPDSLVGTDSHTTMINGLGVMGWGVGGIEAEAVMLGQPYYMTIPEVVGMRLTGELSPGVTATDLVLAITERLRQTSVVEKFVEFFGPGIKRLPLPDRATIANMSPEYGATMGFFPVDEKTIDYLTFTNRGERAAVVEAYTKENGLFYSDAADPEYTRVIEFDLSTAEPCVAGPARPQDRIPLTRLKHGFADIIGKPPAAGDDTRKTRITPVDDDCQTITVKGQETTIGNGSLVIAAITSCTNTSNPVVLIGAGLVARNAVSRGLFVPPLVKTSFAPGSRVVTDYMTAAGLMEPLEKLGFHIAAYGCTTCIGNSGPLDPAVEAAIAERNLTVAAVLSGNRNFEARIHQGIKANFLASPMLVVGFALAGRIDIDFTTEPLGHDPDGRPVYLEELWPGAEEIHRCVASHVKSEFFARQYAQIFAGDQFWEKLSVAGSSTFAWEADSTYLKKPPYFEGFSLSPTAVRDISDARALLLLGDTVTTDHISPAGAIPEKYPAGKYLLDKGVTPADFNSYGSRRGNHEVMMRGTFGNIRIKNRMAHTGEGSFTVLQPEGTEMYVFDAAKAYAREQTPLVVIGGREYGTGSSRDWAAKGTQLLGVRAVLAESYERIHRSNLVGMGVLPLVFKESEGWRVLGLDGSETYSISGITDMVPRKEIAVCATRTDGSEVRFTAIARLDTEVDVAYFVNGGILPCVLRKLMASG